jgi:hypothetical protein
MLSWLFAIAALLLQMRGDVLRIAVVGDVGHGTAEIAQGIDRLHRRAPFDAIVATGDNVYPCGVTSATDSKWDVLQPLAALGIPIFPVLGNHDHCGNADAQIGATPVPNWRFPAREYIVHAGVADLAMLDTTPYARGRGAPPDVAALLSGSSAPWRIAVGHHPLISSGYHGLFSRDEHRRMLGLMPAMSAARIDLYICGHDHHLELIDGRPRMLISGAGSDPRPPILRHGRTIWANEGQPYRGFAVVEIARGSLSVQFFDAIGAAKSRRFEFSKP